MNILKSKKGIALENTIVFMMIIFSFCFLIASFTLLGHRQGEIEQIKLENKLELDQIGEDFLADGDIDVAYPRYHPIIGNNSGKATLTVKAGENGTVVLYVERDSNGNPTVWRYSEP